MTALLTEMTANGTKSIQQINTSLDDDTIIDMLHSSKLQRYFGIEIEEEVDATNTYRRNKIKQLWNNNERKGTDKSRRRGGGSNRSKTRRKRSRNTRYYPSNDDKDNKLSSTKEQRLKNCRSRSVGAVSTKGIMNDTEQSIATTSSSHSSSSRTRHHKHTRSVLSDKCVPKKVNRLVSWFEKLNYTPSRSPKSDIVTMNDSYKHRNNTTPKGGGRYNFFKQSIKISNNDTPISTVSNASYGTQTPSNASSHPYNHHINRNMQQKITWRPSLKDICNDKQLLNALIAFMERIYCEENILFLQSVQQFKSKIDQYFSEYNINNDNVDNLEQKQNEHDMYLSENIERDIDFQIISIYNSYIVSNAQYQV